MKSLKNGVLLALIATLYLSRAGASESVGAEGLPYQVGDVGPSGGVVISVYKNQGVEIAPEDLVKLGRSGEVSKLTLTEAVEGLKNWGLGGQMDWRIPTITELKQVHSMRNLVPMSNDWYWSSTSDIKQNHFGSPDYLVHSFKRRGGGNDSLINRLVKVAKPDEALYGIRPVRSFTDWKVKGVCGVMDPMTNEEKKKYSQSLTIDEREVLQNSRCFIKYEVGQSGPASGWVVASYDNGRHGYEVTAGDYTGVWGCYGVSMQGKAYGRALGAGKQNTLDMINNGCGGIASLVNSLEVNGYKDWWIPSHSAMDTLWHNREVIGLTRTGYIWDSLYWSSTTNEDYANIPNVTNFKSSYIKIMKTSYHDLMNRNYNLKVRPIHSF